MNEIKYFLRNNHKILQVPGNVSNNFNKWFAEVNKSSVVKGLKIANEFINNPIFSTFFALHFDGKR
jgi:hypothetical protein